MADHACPRCKAHDAAVPTEVELRQLIAEEEGLENEAFIPRASTAKQGVALAAFAHAVSLMVAAYGLEIAAARVRRTLAVLGSFARLARIFRRVDEAREPVHAEIHARFVRGEFGPAEANHLAGTAPTPDYDGRERDEAWLKRVIGEGVDAL
jgi:hypothetical protein